MQTIQILIVEDEMLSAIELKNQLEQLGYGVLSIVSNGLDALEFVKKQVPDLIIMDINLGKKSWDGIETNQRIREQIQIPVIYLTSLQEKSVFNKAKHTLPEGFLNKPITPVKLGQSIELAIMRASKKVLVNLKKEEEEVSRDIVFKGLLFLKEEYKLVKVDPHEILYISAADSSCHMHFLKGKRTFSCNLKTMLERLGKANFGSLFYRIHRSHAVAIQHVSVVSGNKVQIGDQWLSIGLAEEYKAFKDLLPSI